MRIATWNINSVRLRADAVRRFLQQYEVDVLCLQETKCPPGQFPGAKFRELGYQHIADNGFTGHHGVAVVSRVPFSNFNVHTFCNRNDGRHVSVELAGADLVVHSIYVPAGGDDPDPGQNPKFAHKLQFLDEFAEFIDAASRERSSGHVFAGDFNVAPLPSDVWSHKQLLKVVSHTPIETSKLLAMKSRAGLEDPIRARFPEPEKLFTWWSYRARDWQASDRGRRLDHIWLSPIIADTCVNAQIVRNVRSWDRPSDHVPVVIDLDPSTAR